MSTRSSNPLHSIPNNPSQQPTERSSGDINSVMDNLEKQIAIYLDTTRLAPPELWGSKKSPQQEGKKYSELTGAEVKFAKGQLRVDIFQIGSSTDSGVATANLRKYLKSLENFQGFALKIDFKGNTSVDREAFGREPYRTRWSFF